MVHTRKQQLVLVCLILLVAFMGITVARIVESTNVATAQQGTGDGTVIKVVSPKAASAITGYSVGTIDSTLMGSLPAVSTYNVEVQLIGPSSETPKLMAVQQEWRLSDGSWLVLGQAPRLNILGSPLTIGGMIGGKLSYEATDKMPQRIQLYWQIGDMGFSLLGTMTSSVNEEILKSLAESVTIR